MKGLRPSALSCWLTIFSLSELTWFMKGLRLQVIVNYNPVHFRVRIDLIYEGIATNSVIVDEYRGPPLSELTWFMKGLRLLKSFGLIGPWHLGPNWPDLWRDCDSARDICNCQAGAAVSELTWFMKGLRPYTPFYISNGSGGSELTWFMKGLRHINHQKHISTYGRPSPNWPDLWRDCDPGEKIQTTKITTAASELTWFMKGLRPFNVVR